MAKKLTEYKGVRLDDTMLVELMDRAELQNKLMAVVYSLLNENDGNYDGNAAAKDLLDIITEHLDMGFQSGSDEMAWKLVRENEELKQRIRQLKG